jgi:hypothetical protein
LTDLLQGVQLKLTRAREHFDHLRQELLAYDERNPYEGIAEVSDDGLEWLLRAAVHEEPNPYWSTIIGDVVHNMRSALDYLTCELVLTNGGTVTNSTLFPIYEQKSRYERGAGSKTAGMDPRAAELIETLQPYYAPTPSEHPLAVLAYLSNGDKHRTLQLARWATDRLRQEIEAAGGPAHIELVEAHQGPIANGDVIVRFRLVPPVPRGLKVNAELTTYLLIEGRWRARRLKGLLNFIEDEVVRRLSPYL